MLQDIIGIVILVLGVVFISGFVGAVRELFTYKDHE